jgi:hypothetical protein
MGMGVTFGGVGVFVRRDNNLAFLFLFVCGLAVAGKSYFYKKW